MSIVEEDVIAVLLNDGWHDVLHESFEIQGQSSNGIGRWFTFTTHQRVEICGPLVSILAYKLSPS